MLFSLAVHDPMIFIILPCNPGNARKELFYLHIPAYHLKKARKYVLDVTSLVAVLVSNEYRQKIGLVGTRALNLLNAALAISQAGVIRGT